MLVAYLNNPTLKEQHLSWLRADIAADRLIAGSYGEPSDNGWRGCQWGCFLRSARPHDIVEERVGIPRQLSKIADGLFEALSRDGGEKGRDFAEAFFVAIEPGANLLIPYWRFMQWLLIDPTDGVLRQAKNDQSKRAIERVGEMYGQLLAGTPVAVNNWRAVYAYAAAAAAAARLKARVRQSEKLLHFLRQSSPRTAGAD